MARPDKNLEKQQDRNSYKFNFESTVIREGYVDVDATVMYEQGRGYGFIKATEECPQDSHQFIVQAMPDNYNITLVARRNQNKESKLGLVIEEISFINEHRLLEEQQETFHFQLALINDCIHFTIYGPLEQIQRLEIDPITSNEVRDKPTLFLASDSTVANYNLQQRPQAGWGEKLNLWLNTELIDIDNRAIGGLSSKTFLVGGHLNQLLLDIQQGDYLMMQWSHNDSTPIRPARYVTPVQFKQYLSLYIKGALQRGATPILVTPVNRRDFTGNQLNYSFPKYVAAMKEVAIETATLLIDLNKYSWSYFQELGVEETKALFMWVDGKEDDTHLHENGAVVVAKMVAALLKSLPSPLASFIKQDVLLHE